MDQECVSSRTVRESAGDDWLRFVVTINKASHREPARKSQSVNVAAKENQNLIAPSLWERVG